MVTSGRLSSFGHKTNVEPLLYFTISATSVTTCSANVFHNWTLLFVTQEVSWLLSFPSASSHVYVYIDTASCSLLLLHRAQHAPLFHIDFANIKNTSKSFSCMCFISRFFDIYILYHLHLSLDVRRQVHST